MSYPASSSSSSLPSSSTVNSESSGVTNSYLKITGNMLYQDVIQHIFTFLSNHEYFVNAVAVSSRWYHSARRQRSRNTKVWLLNSKHVTNLAASSLRHHVSGILLHDYHECGVTDITTLSHSMQHLTKLQCTMRASELQPTSDINLSFPPNLTKLRIFLRTDEWISVYVAAFSHVINAISLLHSSLTSLTLSVSSRCLHNPTSFASSLQPLHKLQLLESFAVMPDGTWTLSQLSRKPEDWQWITLLPKLQTLYAYNMNADDVKFLASHSAFANKLTNFKFTFDYDCWPAVLQFHSLTALRVLYKDTMKLELRTFSQLRALTIRFQTPIKGVSLVADLQECSHLDITTFSLTCHRLNLTSALLESLLQPLKKLTKLRIDCRCNTCALEGISFIKHLPHLHQQLTSLTLDIKVSPPSFMSDIILFTSLKELKIDTFLRELDDADIKALTPSSPTRLPQLQQLTSFKYKSQEYV